MTFKSKEEMHDHSKEIDLTGPKGNAFYLIGLARQLAKELDLDVEVITEDMQSGDYEHLLEVFEEHFGMIYTLYR
jgi:hypothetical protein